MPGYSILMNPEITFLQSLVGCDISINISGGYPSVTGSGADYSWSYQTPLGNTITGTGSNIAFTANEDGNYVFSIINDGTSANSCDLPIFTSIFTSGCNCTTNLNFIRF